MLYPKSSVQMMLALMALVLLGGCGRHDIDAALCEPVGAVKPICGIEKPEDLALLPDAKTLVLSLYGSMFSFEPGALALFDTQTEQLTTLPVFDKTPQTTWPGMDCPSPPGELFSPHGIHYSQTVDGSGQLLVVNHGGRESVEFFAVKPTANSYELQWQGCVLLPENHFANTVVATPQGGFIFSHMFAKNSPRLGTTSWAALKAVFGVPSGYAMEWKGPEVGDGKQFAVVAGSESGFPNGLQLSPDGRYLFLNTSVDGYVHKIDRHSGTRVASSDKLPHLDNMQWDQHGYLLVASMPTGLLESVRCLEISATTNCGGAYNIVRINPADMSSEVVFAHKGGAPMGGATVAAQVGDALFIGSYAGNRLLKVPYSRP